MSIASLIVSGGSGGGITPGSANTVLTSTGSDTSWIKLTDTYISDTAAISGLKLYPDFGNQGIVTTGTMEAGSILLTSYVQTGIGTYQPSSGQIRLRSGTAQVIAASFDGSPDVHVISRESGSDNVIVGGGDNTVIKGGTTSQVIANSTGLKFFASGTPVAKPTVSGAKGSNAALASLLTALSNLGLVTDNTSA